MTTSQWPNPENSKGEAPTRSIRAPGALSHTPAPPLHTEPVSCSHDRPNRREWWTPVKSVTHYGYVLQAMQVFNSSEIKHSSRGKYIYLREGEALDTHTRYCLGYVVGRSSVLWD